MVDKLPGSKSSIIDDLGKLYDDLEKNAANQQELTTKKSNEDKLNIDKMTIDKEMANKAKMISDLFFKWMMSALSQSTNMNDQLLNAAEQSGFNNVPDALNNIQNSDGQSPLQYLIQKQLFSAVQQLINSGARIGPIEKAVLDIASDSKAGRLFGLTPSSTSGEKLHPVKNFGLVLGIEMTGKDGTFSQYGHIAPTYQLMTDALQKHAQRGPDQKEFKEIAEAFSFSNKAASFSNSTPQRIPQAGAEMAKRIQSGKVTTIPVSCEGHAMGMSVVPDGPGSKSGYLVYTNRGLGAQPSEYGTQIYRIDDVNKVTPQFINQMMTGFSEGRSHDQIKQSIAQVTGGKAPVHVIQQKGQKVDNCTIVNSGSNVHGILLCQEAKAKGGFAKLNTTDINSVEKKYKQFKADMKADKVNELVNAITKNPNDADLINLGKGFLNKKTANPHLKAQISKALGTPLEQQPVNTQQTKLSF